VIFLSDNEAILANTLASNTASMAVSTSYFHHSSYQTIYYISATVPRFQTSCLQITNEINFCYAISVAKTSSKAFSLTSTLKVVLNKSA
jgi:hypothetical protein